MVFNHELFERKDKGQLRTAIYIYMARTPGADTNWHTEWNGADTNWARMVRWVLTWKNRSRRKDNGIVENDNDDEDEDDNDAEDENEDEDEDADDEDHDDEDYDMVMTVMNMVMMIMPNDSLFSNMFVPFCNFEVL